LLNAHTFFLKLKLPHQHFSSERLERGGAIHFAVAAFILVTASRFSFADNTTYHQIIEERVNETHCRQSEGIVN
jgi:type VI protein secretion system component VasK